MLIFEYYYGQLECMFTDQDKEYVDRMCWRLDNPIGDVWRYQTEDRKQVLYWRKDGRLHGNLQGLDEKDIPESSIANGREESLC